MYMYKKDINQMSSVAFVVSSAYFWVVHHNIPLNNQILGIQKIDTLYCVHPPIQHFHFERKERHLLLY